YGGAYAYGKTRIATGYDGSGVRVKQGRMPRGEWLALMPGTHEGYVDWERAEAIRRMVSDNVPTSRHHGAPKHGDALLAGLVRCRRCGRKLTVRLSYILQRPIHSQRSKHCEYVLYRMYYRHRTECRGSVRGVVGIMSGIISENLVIAYYAARS